MNNVRRGKIIVPRAVLLIEIERRCCVSNCAAKNRVGLTKAEALVYRGFECERCERWNEDYLVERDLPEWWEELTITGLHGLRSETSAAFEPSPGEIVLRLSGNYQHLMNSQVSSNTDGDKS